MAEWSGVRMTKKYLVELCQRHDGYRTPSVNDKLYLHQQGFRPVSYTHLTLPTKA